MTTLLRPTKYSLRSLLNAGRERLVIGLVNNMPDAALQMTEQQFAHLLSADENYDVRLRLFSFPELIRGDAGRAYVADRYEPIEQLWAADVDGLIITGAEPRTSALSDEAYWPSLTRLVEWAEETATPTIWSCLAAHAAVLHLDGIARRPLSEKISGVFACSKRCDHPLLHGLPSSWRIPHSRQNTLDPEQLSARGYEILALSEEAGADTFFLHRRAPFVFFQGHPEYDAGALFREYRRDVGRFLSGSVERYPEMPRGYFDDVATRAFTAFRARAHRERNRALLADFPSSDGRERPAHLWRDVAVRVYSNWLAHLASSRRHATAIAAAVVPARVP